MKPMLSAGKFACVIGAALIAASCHAQPQPARPANEDRATAAAPTSAAPARATGFSWELRADRLALFHEGAPLADYVFSDPATLRPHFQNLRAPSGVPLTRTHPPAAGDATDHATMHPGVWLAFGDISGEDFWRNKARVEHVRFVPSPEMRNGTLSFATENRLLARDGSELARQRSSFSVRRSGATAFLLTWTAEIGSDARELVFGDQEEMGLGVRLATPLTEKAGGLVVTSDGVQGAKVAWGKPAEWAAYGRELDGRLRGVAIFPARSNPAPTWWHSRDYGVIVANGFGKRVLPSAADGKLLVKRGEKLTLRYGVLLYDAPRSAPIDFEAVNRAFQTAAGPGR
jgi:hypothetical protein